MSTNPSVDDSVYTDSLKQYKHSNQNTILINNIVTDPIKMVADK